MRNAETHVVTRPYVIASLNACIEKCTDGERGYAAAAADVRSPPLKLLLQRLSAERAEFAIALQRAVENLGAFAQNEGSIMGAGHRGWMAIRHGVEMGSDRAILEECVRGERSAYAAYKTALARIDGEPRTHEVRALLELQRDEIATAIAELQPYLTLH